MRILVAVIIAAVSAAASPSCPPGFVHVPQGNSCVCADWPNKMVICDEDSPNASMRIGYCMTYDNETNELRAGRCINTIFRKDSHKFYMYYQLPTNLSALNDQVCGPSNSKGLLCGECQDGFAVAALWNVFCINCTSASNGWIKFVAAQYLPLTVVFILIIVFAINIVSGPINSLIFFAQANTLNPDVTFIIMHTKVQNMTMYSTYIDALKRSPGTVTATLYDAWNLNVSPRAYIPLFCLTDHLTKFQALTLVYIRAFYPLVLIVFLYIGIKLHNWNFRVVVYCWKPFLKPFLRFRRSVDPKTSVIDVFATFILLSYGKLILVVMFFLNPQPLYNGEGQKLSSAVMAYSTSTLFFHKEHLPLAIFSIFVSLTFIAVPPIVLLFYQASFLQKCLTQCKLSSQALRIFVEIFQGCYKDGTNGTRDCRYFAGLYFIFRVVAIMLFLTNLINASVLFYVFIALLFALVQPYKEYVYNVIDAVMFGLMGTISFLVMWNVEYSQSHGQFSAPLLVLTEVLYSFPLLYLVLFIVYWVLDRKTSYIQKLKSHKCLRSFFQVQEEERVYFDDVVPHRLLNPEEYEEL